MTPAETLTLATYFFVLVILAVYGWHRYYLVYLYMKHKDRRPVPQGELPALPSPPPAGLPGELLLRRPDLRAAELRLAAADDRLYEARADLIPRLELTATAGRTSAELADLLDGDFSV